MAQRISNYARIAGDRYPTPAAPALALLPYLDGIHKAWDPCADADNLVMILRAHGVAIVGTSTDFFAFTAPPEGADTCVLNPPYGVGGRTAVAFIETSLRLVPCTFALLRNDFNSAKSRQHLFRNNPHFAFKLVLLDRVRWFEGPSSPSDNHAWFGFDRGHRGPPIIHYASNADTAIDLPASNRWLPSSVGQRSA